jgi:multidrug resistance efflux pump
MWVGTKVLLGAGAVLALVSAGQADQPKAPAGGEVIRQPGAVVPAQTIRVSARVGGTVREVLVDAGDQVKEGQVLARLDRAEAELGLKQAEAAVERAKAIVIESEAQVAQRQAEIHEAEAAVKAATAQRRFQQAQMDRMRDLFKNHSIDQRLVDEAENKHLAAEAQVRQAEAHLATMQAGTVKAHLATARADLAAAEARRDLAKLRVEAAEVRSPIAGTVLARHINAGDFAAGPAQGRPTVLFEVADLSRLDVVAQVPERDYARVKPGQSCEVRIDAVPGTVYKGRVARVAPALSPSMRTAAARVRLEVPREDHALRPGMYGSVSFLTK